MLKNILNNIWGKKTLNMPYFWKDPKEENFNFDLIEQYFKHKVHSDKFQIINNQIMNDIDFQELFMFMDRTHSKIGQQYLYNRLLTIDARIDFKEQEQVINYFFENEEQKIKAQSLLSKLNRRESHYISNLFLDGYIPKPKWFWVIGILSAVSFIALIFTFLYNKIFILLLIIYLVNMAIHFWNKRNIMVYMDSIPQLSVLCRVAKEMTKMDVLPESKPLVLLSVKSILNLKNNIKFFKLNTGIKSDVEAVLLFVWEIIKILFLIEPLIVFDVLKKLEIKRNDIQMIFEYLGKLDSAISIATIRQKMPYYCKPTISDMNKSVEFTDIYHPLIPDCVPNSLKLTN